MAPGADRHDHADDFKNARGAKQRNAATAGSGIPVAVVTNGGRRWVYCAPTRTTSSLSTPLLTVFGNLEANVNGALAHGFDSSFGSQVSVLSFGSIAPFPILNSTWVEYGGRLGYRFSRNLVVDAFAIGTLGGEVGRTLHVGLGARYAF